jgi:heme/copper-type cytochrome/quinol oxidase subunit 4
MRILIRTSKWAVWARRFGALALPLALIPVLLHRAHAITSDNFVIIEAAAMVLAAIAVAMALIAFARLWVTGDQGWSRAALAFVFGAICLLPAAYFGWLATSIPETADVATDFANPPTLVSFVESRFIGPEERARIEATYPNARSRNYPIEAPQMFTVIETLIDTYGWDIRARRAPQGPLDSGQLNAVVTTLLGFSQEAAIRVAGGADGTTVDMRSTSLSSFPDFGENGQRVESFLLALDNQVTLMLRNAPAQPAAAD